LTALIAQSGGEVSQIPTGSRPADTTSILAALLPEQVVYCRVATFRPQASWDGLASELGRWIGQGASGVILDLRSNGMPDDFEGAARLAGLFMPAGTPLFSLRDARKDARAFVSMPPEGAAPGIPITVPLAILIDHRTEGAAEAFSAALRLHGAVVFGEATAGRGGVFSELALNDNNALRYLSGEVILPDGSSLWNHPVAPDIDVVADEKTERITLGLIEQHNIADVIGEAAQRHRMSEASLVNGEDPEIDASLAAQAAHSGAQPSALATQDIVLVNALDSLKAIRFSQRADAAPAAGPVNSAAAR
jgi:C-terminal processing protease CtpA/Prc